MVFKNVTIVEETKFWRTHQHVLSNIECVELKFDPTNNKVCEEICDTFLPFLPFEVSSAIIDNFAPREGNMFMLSTLSGEPSTTPELLKKIVTCFDVNDLRLADEAQIFYATVARHSNITPEVAKIIMLRGNEKVHIHLASNPDTPEQILQGLFETKNLEVILNIITNPTCSSMLLDKILKHFLYLETIDELEKFSYLDFVIEGILTHPNLNFSSQEFIVNKFVMEKEKYKNYKRDISVSKVPIILQSAIWLAGNQNTPLQLLRTLVDTGNDELKLHVALWGNCDDDLFDILVQDDKLMSPLAGNEHSPHYILKQIFERYSLMPEAERTDVAYRLSKHSNATNDIVAPVIDWTESKQHKKSILINLIKRGALTGVYKNWPQEWLEAHFGVAVSDDDMA